MNTDNVDGEMNIEMRKSTRFLRNSRVSSIRSRAEIIEALKIKKESREADFDEVTLRPNSTPKEDMSKIKSAFIGNDVMLSDRTSAERKSRLRKFVTSKSENVVSSVSSNLKGVQERLSKLKTGETLVRSLHSGVLLEPGNKDRTEWRVTMDSEVIRWIGDRGKGMLPINKINSITAVNSGDEEYRFGFEIGYIEDKTLQIQVFASKTETDRGFWIQKILEMTITEVYPDSLMNRSSRAGLVNIKEGVGGIWIKTWLIIQDRGIYFCSQRGNFFAADLTKARTVITQEVDGNLAVLLDLQERVLYVQDHGHIEQETRRWSQCLREAALCNGDTLSQLQLTREDVPVIVDKCIKFVAAHGMNTEGIYRRTDNVTSVSKLLAQFRLKDAWKLQLDQEYPLEVAKALLTFLIELREPLLPESCIQHLVFIPTSRMHEGAKVNSYRHLMQDLPKINYATVRRVFGHLHFLHQSGKTCARNLADCWISAFSSDMKFLLNENCANAIEAMIVKYPGVFDASNEEIERDEQVLHAIQRLSDPERVEKTRHSELLVWVHIGKYQSEDQVQVMLELGTTAKDVCQMLGTTNLATVLQEVVLGGALTRPLHPEENVMSAVMHWATWQDNDRKDNQLVLMDSSFFLEMRAKGKPRSVTFGELKFADPSTKHFSVCDVEMTQTSLVCFKDKRNNIKHGEWNIRDIIWYVGFEPKREPLSKWTITFITKDHGPVRSRELPYFGCAFGGSSKKELLYWSTGFMLAQFPGLL